MFAQRGTFRAGACQLGAIKTSWFRLRATADELADGTHMQLFACTNDSGNAPSFQPSDENPFADPAWQPKPRDVLDVLIQGPPTQYLWIGGILRSDGRFSPSLRQMRVDYGRDTYLDFLPALYAKDQARSEFLERFLALHQSVLGGIENSISDLPLLFDPQAAPAAGEFPSWLSWLAGWLDFDLDESWSESQLRRYLAAAFELYGKRGTIEGLRR